MRMSRRLEATFQHEAQRPKKVSGKAGNEKEWERGKIRFLPVLLTVEFFFFFFFFFFFLSFRVNSTPRA